MTSYRLNHLDWNLTAFSLAITFEHDANGHQEQETAKQHGAQVDGIGGGIQKQNDLKVVLLNVRSLKNEAKNEAKNADDYVK